METQRYLPIIEKLIEETGAHESNMLSDCLLRVVTYELLFGKGLGGRDAGSFRKGIRPYQRKMKDALKKLKEDMGASNGKELLEKFGLQAKEDPMPRWVRVNLLKTTVQEVEETFIADGCICILSWKEVGDLVRGKDAKAISSLMDEYTKSLQPWQFMSDLHLPDVLVFSPATPLFKHHLTLDKKIILMDKASCIPARVLSPPIDGHVVDACAAPGNKTNHLSCIMQNTGKVFAFDLDQKRTETLKAMVEKSGSTNVEAQCADFLEVDPTDPKYVKVTHILTDPSCSGSGIVSRKDHLTGETTSRTRLKLLRGLQLRILNHAMSFPAVERVIYSTCSVHREENEEVVWRILEANPEFDLETVLPSWHHRPTKASSRDEEGEDQNEEEYYETDVNYSHLREKLDEEITRKCLRASFNEDKTNGFFVALFKKSRNFSNETGQGEGEQTVGEDETQEGEVEGNCKDDEYAEVEQVKQDRSKLMDASEHGLDATTKSKKRGFSHSAEADSSWIKGENSLKKKKKKRKKDKTRDKSVLNEDDFEDVKQFDHSLEDAKVTLTSDDADNDVDVKADVGKRIKKRKRQDLIEESQGSHDIGVNNVREDTQDCLEEGKRKPKKKKKDKNKELMNESIISTNVEDNVENMEKEVSVLKSEEDDVQRKKQKRKRKVITEVNGVDDNVRNSLDPEGERDGIGSGVVEGKQREEDGSESQRRRKKKKKETKKNLAEEVGDGIRNDDLGKGEREVRKKDKGAKKDLAERAGDGIRNEDEEKGEREKRKKKKKKKTKDDIKLN
ncbi:uncharacterized protein [Apostichopus japonicus]